MFKKILVPLDGSETALQVLPVVQGLVEGTEAEITLFAADLPPNATPRRRTRTLRAPVAGPGMSGSIGGVVRPPEAMANAESRSQAIERREHELLDYLADVAARLTEAGARVRTAVHFGEPATEITQVAARGGFDLIAMATHGRSGLSRRLHGSVTAAVIRSGATPVLVVNTNVGTRKKSS